MLSFASTAFRAIKLAKHLRPESGDSARCNRCRSAGLIRNWQAKAQLVVVAPDFACDEPDETGLGSHSTCGRTRSARQPHLSICYIRHSKPPKLKGVLRDRLLVNGANDSVHRVGRASVAGQTKSAGLHEQSGALDKGIARSPSRWVQSAILGCVDRWASRGVKLAPSAKEKSVIRRYARTSKHLILESVKHKQVTTESFCFTLTPGQKLNYSVEGQLAFFTRFRRSYLKNTLTMNSINFTVRNKPNTANSCGGCIKGNANAPTQVLSLAWP
jgi:hypothetical protein